MKRSLNVQKSPLFQEIYNQALQAESLKLNHIAGMGYRKALEFLIKDYLINFKEEDAEVIKGKLLGRCIKNHIENENIRELAERAAWLGNDETHYYRTWIGKDINDLKQLIDLVIHWISMEILTKKMIEGMPK
jgi:hypothetical protein